MNESPQRTFEEAMTRLEEIVRILEKGETTLEESLRLYREGSLCSRFCRDKLEHAEHELKLWQDGLSSNNQDPDQEND